MVELIISAIALIISIIALKRTSKAKTLELKHKYLQELYEVRTKVNRLKTGTERQLEMIDELKHICNFISTEDQIIKSKEKSHEAILYSEFLDARNKMSTVNKVITESEKSCKDFYEKTRKSEEELEILSSIDNPKDKDFTDIHSLKTLIQMRINEQEANFESVSEPYKELRKLYYSILYESL